MTTETSGTAPGWGVLHLFCKLTEATDTHAVTTAVKEAAAGEHQVVSVSVLGHKADLGFMALGPDVAHLRRFQTALRGAGLDLVDSYVSLTEVSEYAKGMPEDRLRDRLYPTLPPPAKPAFCFYPMSKRRHVGQNWYALPYEQRHELMLGHGKVGRTFAGRVVQLITGSTGLDDYEWGVTLFATTHDDLKDVVYTMRFDEASAVYAEFGPFVTGTAGPVDDVLREVGAPARRT